MSDVQALRFDDDGETPNNPRLPLLLYRGALTVLASVIRLCPSSARSPGTVGPTVGVTASIFPALHTTAHEAFGIARGRATVRVRRVPAARSPYGRGRRRRRAASRLSGHQRLDSTPDLLVVGPIRGTLGWISIARKRRPPHGPRQHRQVPMPPAIRCGPAGPLVALWST